MRQGNRWDGTLGGNNFRLKRGEGSYTKQLARSEGVPFQDLSNSRGQFNTRQDLRSVFQTSWAGGATWEKPLLSDVSMDTYYTSQGFNLTAEPGNLYPIPTVLQEPITPNIAAQVPPVQVSSTEIYYAESSGGSEGLILWDGSAASVLTNDFGVTSQQFMAMCWDAANATVYALFSDGKVAYVTPDSAGGVIRDVGTVYDTANIFMHFGRLMVWTGDILIEVTDPLGTDGQTTIYDDGMGPDVTEEMAGVSSDVPIGYRTPRLAVPSSEGIWLVKNVNHNGLPTPTIHRIDRTNDGENIGTPVASLPSNTVVLDVAYHLGGLLLSTASDMTRLFGNDISSYGHIPITIYSLINGSLGTVGSPLGLRAPDDTPFKFLASDGPLLYIGGANAIFQYDAVRGGLHQLVNTTLGGSEGTFTGLAFTTNDDSEQCLMLSHYGYTDLLSLPLQDEGGQSAQHPHTLESNYFDFNVPAEQKTITHVTVMTDGPDSGFSNDETWTVSIETDDGSFTQVATHTAANGKTAKQRLSTVQTGYRFRYKVAWTHSTGDLVGPSRLKGIVFHAVQGTMVTKWALSLDGTEFRNVENTPQRPEDVLDWIETQAANAAIISYVDEYKKNAASTHNVKIESVSVTRSAPQEIDSINVILTEDN